MSKQEPIWPLVLVMLVIGGGTALIAIAIDWLMTVGLGPAALVVLVIWAGGAFVVCCLGLIASIFSRE